MDWALLVERYRASGLDRESFAEREGVQAGTLSRWASRLHREAGRKRTTKKVGPRSARFLPVRVVAAPPPPSMTQDGFLVEVSLSHGAVLRLNPERLSEHGMVRLAALAKELCR